MAENLVEVKDVKKYFKSGHKTLRAVDGVSLSIEKGKTMGLIGESGCGKTTLGRTIMRIYPMDGGSVLYDGQDISKLSKKESKALTARMQMIYQDPYASLNPFYTVEQIISEGMDIHGIYTGKAVRKERLKELMNMVGLKEEQLYRFPHEFSGGQRQRVGIARALSLDPEFVVCDEAISALDVSIQAQIMNMLIDFQNKLGLTYLFIAHDISMVQHISDQISVMYVGALVESGDTEEICTHALHPYTMGLLSAVPLADPRYMRTHNRMVMQGEVPSPTDVTTGCKFATRCPYATERCRQETPELRDVGSGHFVACHIV